MRIKDSLKSLFNSSKNIINYCQCALEGSIKFSNQIYYLSRLIIYFIIGILIIILYFIFLKFGFDNTDVNSARYVLSALVQSEAAIFAIVITLSIVAVQLASQSYSVWVIETFKKTPDVWILISIYGFSIFYGLFDLNRITEVKTVNILFSIFLGIFSFVALIPYISHTIDLLKPTTLLHILARRITKKNLIFSHKKPYHENDPVKPIIDLIKKSLLKNNYDDLSDALFALDFRICYILSNNEFSEYEEEKASNHIFSHLDGIGKILENKMDEYSIHNLMYCLFSIGETAAKQKLENVTSRALISLRNFGLLAADQKLKKPTKQATVYIEKVLEITKELELIMASEMAEECLKEINNAILPNFDNSNYYD